VRLTLFDCACRLYGRIGLLERRRRILRARRYAPLSDELPIDGPGAPPRANGELVFQAPWESRAFGMAVALHRRGAFEWPEFQRRLIDEIARWERDHPSGEGYPYYALWLGALEALLSEKQMCAGSELERRTAEFASRSHGHDH
jgi:nitrile hydratase accessory protein